MFISGETSGRANSMKAEPTSREPLVLGVSLTPVTLLLLVRRSPDR
jgi:hypothetical protein